jgi:hypothetical protein
MRMGSRLSKAGDVRQAFFMMGQSLPSRIRDRSSLSTPLMRRYFKPPSLAVRFSLQAMQIQRSSRDSATRQMPHNPVSISTSAGKKTRNPLLKNKNKPFRRAA